jgi:murein L,D-transpeptidase YafK
LRSGPRDVSILKKRSGQKTGNMVVLRVLLVLALAFGLSACGSKFKTYNGPEVTRVEVHKTDRKMYLLHNAEVLKDYDISLGFQPRGHKKFEGDGKTPEGAYFITHRNPRSSYHLSLGISYPNQTDRAYASSKGKTPGGDIFIHGHTGTKGNRGDWTAGCIAVRNREMEDIYAMVRPGTPIVIFP